MTESQPGQNEQRSRARRTAAILAVVAAIVYLAFIASGIV